LKGGAYLAVFISALTPFAIVVLLVLGSTQGFVGWRPPVLWTSQFGNPNMISGVSGIGAGDNGVYIAGAVNYTISPGYNATFVPFLRGYKTDGSVAWTNMVGNTPQFYFTGLAVGADAIYGLGYDSSNTTLLKYNFSGIAMWADVVVAGFRPSVVSWYAGGIYVAGLSSRPLTNQPFTGSVTFVREYGSNGGVVWTDEFSNSSDDVLAIYATASGVFVLTTLSIVGYSLDGHQLWLHRIGIPYRVNLLSISTGVSGLYFAETVSQCGVCPQAAFLSKYSFGGSLVWNVTFQSPDRSEPVGALLWADSSGIYLSSSGGTYGYIEKYDQNGNSLWTMKTPLPPGTGLTSKNDFLVTTGSGAIYIAGTVGASHGKLGLVQAFGASPSLVFFGVNPPFSFVLLGVLIAVAGLSLFLLWKRRARILAQRPKSASPDRYRKPRYTIADLNNLRFYLS
jgi:hypothetical protein